MPLGCVDSIDWGLAAVLQSLVMACLQEFDGFQPGRRHALAGDRMVLGRHPDCDIVIESAAVSRQHAQILRIDGGLFVEDLGSRNGTFVNEQLVQGRQRLADNDRIRDCEVALQFSDSSASGITSGLASSSLAVLVDDEPVSRLSSVMSKVDVASAASGMQLAVRPEAKLRAMIGNHPESEQGPRPRRSCCPKLLDSLFKIFVQADRGFIVLRDARAARLCPRRSTPPRRLRRHDPHQPHDRQPGDGHRNRRSSRPTPPATRGST